MRIKLTNPITGKSRIERAYFTIDHPASRYNQPVLIVGGEPIDVMNWVMQGATIVDPPKRAEQVRLLTQWQSKVAALL